MIEFRIAASAIATTPARCTKSMLANMKSGSK